MFTKPKDTYDSALKRVNEVKRLVSEIDIEAEKKTLFSQFLQKRIDDFEIALKEEQNCDEKEQIIQQYNRFTKTLLNCLNIPRAASYYTNNYQRFNYYPVGVKGIPQIPPLRFNLSISTIFLGAALILASLASFAIHPLIAAILLPIGITVFAPSCYSLFTPELPNAAEKKREEQLIFQMAAQLKDPSIQLDTIEEPDNESFTTLNLHKIQ